MNPLQILSATLLLSNIHICALWSSALTSVSADSSISSTTFLRQRDHRQEDIAGREFDHLLNVSGIPVSADKSQQEAVASAESESSASSSKRQREERKMFANNVDNMNSRTYELWEAKTIWEKLESWARLYPKFVDITTSQEKYNLPRAGGSDDCPYDHLNGNEQGCNNYILTIQDFVTHPEASESSRLLPEVLWSGTLHGDERVGPTAIMEAANLLLEAASCEAMSPPDNDRSFSGSYHSCRTILAMNYGMSDVERKWLARLVATRRIVVVPTANALGYYRNTRREERVDPNRDFPYDVLDSQACMQTIAGRTLNEVFRDHMFQLSLTYHGGMEVIAYEWGNPSGLGYLSPDHASQDHIAKAFSQFSGSFATSPNYPTGTMNDLVYYVRGGFEDWAYAGSWDPANVIECQPNTYNGYPREKTRYDDSTLRAFNMLVETSNRKRPLQSSLGSSMDLLKSDNAGNGHVSRNIRLSLISADLVEPYVSILGTNDDAVSDNWIPLERRKVDNDNGLSCKESNKLFIPATSANEIHIYWTVGGALEIDNTQVWYGKWDDFPSDEALLDDCMIQPSVNFADMGFFMGNAINATSGTGYFSSDGPSPRPDSTPFGETLGPVFHAIIDVSSITNNNQTSQEIVVIASAMVDQSWTHQPSFGYFKPNLPPQSHVVNARTNPLWYHENGAGKKIQGRLQWYSMPLTIVLGDSDEATPVSTTPTMNIVPATTSTSPATPSPSMPPTIAQDDNVEDNDNDRQNEDNGDLALPIVESGVVEESEEEGTDDSGGGVTFSQFFAMLGF